MNATKRQLLAFLMLWFAIAFTVMGALAYFTPN
jgi:hypothetical protein